MHHLEFGIVFVWKQLAGKIAVRIPSTAVLEKKKGFFFMENFDFKTQNLKILAENCGSLPQCGFLFSKKNKIA